MCSYYTSTLSLTFPVLNVLNNAAIDKLSQIQNELLHVCLVSVFPLNSSKIIWKARELSFESLFLEFDHYKRQRYFLSNSQGRQYNFKLLEEQG